MASLGTTGVLIGCALLLLVVVSAIVAFRGWPAGGAVGDETGVSIDGDRALTELAPVRFEAGPAALATASTPTVRAGGRAAESRLAVDAGQVQGASESGVAAPARDGAAPASSGSAPGVGQPSPAPAAQDVGAGVGGVTGGLTGATENATQGVAEALGGVDDQLGQSVSDTGQVVSDLVQRGAELEQRQELPELP
jgi:hypothetical protein